VFFVLISWSGLHVGHDRGTTVTDYTGDGRHLGPFPFTGTLTLTTVTVDLLDDQTLDHTATSHTEISHQ
jgi:arylsulfatase